MVRRVLALLAVLSVAAAAVVVAVKSDDDFLVRQLAVYGAPLVGVRYGDQPADGLHTQEALGWRSLYDAPFIAVLQEDPSRAELSGFLVKDGLRSLPLAEDRRPLHQYLLSGPEKVGLLLSGSNFVSLPHVDMPIVRFSLPARFSLAESARLHADFYSFPTLLLVDRELVSAADLARLALVADFTLLRNAVKVSSDVPAPAAHFGRRHTAAHSVVNGVSSAPRAADVAESAFNPFARRHS